MESQPLPIDGLVLVALDINRDDRGFFTERYKGSAFAAGGIPEAFVQDNHSRSAPGVLRGLHYQYAPSQGKLVSVARGRIWDVAVDLRTDSPTFGKSYGVELTDGLILW